MDKQFKRNKILIYLKWLSLLINEIIIYCQNVEHFTHIPTFQSLDCVQGTYTWVINYLEVNSRQQKEVVGHVNLLR
ncbi:MAG: hypothetical protein EBS34_11235 [Flavobacteriales bacterium]|nr:hypothetical protein [Flavobacteriales bacterium]